MSLIWSTGMILIRFIIGLAHLWCHELLVRPSRPRGSS